MARNRKRKGQPVHGWLALDKPSDMTSTQAVGILRKLFDAQKAGHGGTLDPLADGILPIAFGEATKTVQWAMDGDKDYRFTIRWGISTETLDAEGGVTARSDARPGLDEVEAALARFIGEIEQIPPKYSAIKVDGERAYDLARDGEAFDIPSRCVHVHAARILETPDEDHAVIQVRSGKGFYVRALARDLAAALGCDGHVSQLRRTRVGPLDEAKSVSLEALDAMADADERRASLLPLETVLEDVPRVEIGADEAGLIRQGRDVVLLPHLVEKFRTETSSDPDDRLAIAMHSGLAVAMGEVRAGRFQPNRVFQM